MSSGLTLMIKFSTPAFFDTHAHLRDVLEVTQDLVRYAIQGGADTVMFIPNFKDGLMTANQVYEYKRATEKLIPRGQSLRLIPSMMVNEDTPLDELCKAADRGIFDIKLMPFGRSTNSEFGFKYFWKLIPQIKLCGELGIRVHLHPEHPWELFGGRDAEYQSLTFAEMALTESPDVRFFWEHGTDARCIPFWKFLARRTNRFFVTLTAHHLHSNEDRAFGDVRRVCKPQIKTERDRCDLCRLVAEDHYWVMAGGDGASHPDEAKHVPNGKCACGANTSPFLLPLYAHSLHPVLDLGSLEGQRIFSNFTSGNARAIFAATTASRMITLVQEPFQIPPSYPVGGSTRMAYGAGETIDFQIVEP